MTTNVSRPIHLQLRPTSMPFASSVVSTPTRSQPVKVLASSSASSTTCPSSGSSSTGAASDSLPSQILPHLFVGNQEQTNRDTVNRLEISYILSLGLLPLISDSTQPQNSLTTNAAAAAASPATKTTTPKLTTNATINNNNTTTVQPNANDLIVLPSQNSSKDYKIRVRSSSCSGGGDSSSSNSAIRKNLNINDNNDTNENHEREEAAVKAAVRYIQCKCINIADSSSEQTNLTKFFDEAHQFIDEARRKKCNILVHCLAGISRSPTIAIAYLMKVNSLRLQDAYNLVKQCRPQIDVNLSFMGQLMIYGKRLLTSCRRPIPRQSTGDGAQDGNHLAINSSSSSSSSSISCDTNNVNNVNHHQSFVESNAAARILEEHSYRCTSCQENWLIAKLL